MFNPGIDMFFTHSRDIEFTPRLSLKRLQSASHHSFLRDRIPNLGEKLDHHVVTKVSSPCIHICTVQESQNLLVASQYEP